ncbi:hypothetical protein VTK73DRAFT_8717 [Phialemonium thermophilum]|uniref:Zn(2)-C6 fungal-type domain-containing protein n=1 Tax=Phialemonium thermophilum TaxID=223376 RepID=A0ABR3XMZ2_9PEZI
MDATSLDPRLRDNGEARPASATRPEPSTTHASRFPPSSGALEGGGGGGGGGGDGGGGATTSRASSAQAAQQYAAIASQRGRTQDTARPPHPVPPSAAYSSSSTAAAAYSPDNRGGSATPSTSSASSVTATAPGGDHDGQQHHPQHHPQHYQQHQQPRQSTPPDHGLRYPHFPPSSTSAYGAADGATTPSGAAVDPKKARACESCRGLKVRCEPDPTNPDGPCRRCAKARRACVIHQPTRKRQKKTDSRVAELERKIDALTASLQASRGTVGALGGGGIALSTGGGALGNDATVPMAGFDNPRPAARYDVASGGGGGGAGASARGASEGAETPSLLPSLKGSGWPRDAAERNVPTQTSRPQGTSALYPDDTHAPPGSTSSSGGGGGGGSTELKSRSDGKGYQLPMVMAGQKRKFTEASRDSASEGLRDAAMAPTPTHSDPSREQLDIIDRGFLTMDTAARLFARYVNDMCPHLPAVVFPAGTLAADVRKSKPVLFLSIMAAASFDLPDLQRRLVRELMEIVAHKAVVVGEKSLELVQALHVAVIWYWPPEHFDELKFYQLIHIAGVMAIDLGLGRKVSGRVGLRRYMTYTPGHQQFSRNPLPDPTGVEARRTWLACYFLATNASMALHRPNLIRWTSFMQDSVDLLQSSPEAAPTDKYLCHLVWTHKMAEDVGVQFSLDDPSISLNISDLRTQYTLRGFARDLERYARNVPEELQQPSLKMSFHVVSLYMHEAATQVTTDETKPPSTAEDFKNALSSMAPLTPAHIAAFSACLAAIDGVFDVFLSLDVASIRCLPVFNFIRVAYAVVVLIKMYFAASSPNSELGKVIDKDNMKVERHLDDLLAKFRAVAADDKSRPASKLLVVLAMVRTWFQRQSQGGGPPGNPLPSCAKDGRAYRYRQEPTLTRSGGAPGPSQTPPSTSQRQQPAEYSGTANTPLQVLSEIATNDSAATPSGGTAAGNANGDFTPWFPNSRTSSSATTAAGPGTTAQTASFLYDSPVGGNNPQLGQVVLPGMASDDAAGNRDVSSAAVSAAAAAAAAAAGADGMGGSGGAAVTGMPPPPFLPDFAYSGLPGDGFAQALDFTLAGLSDGTLFTGIPSDLRFFMPDVAYTGIGGDGGSTGAAGDAGMEDGSRMNNFGFSF